MIIKQFEYKPLAHYSYAIVSDGKMAIIDAERDPSQYYAFAKASNAQIVAIIQTHPHADFVSSHLEIHNKTGAAIYNSQKLGADYAHVPFDNGDTLALGNCTLKAIDTPGHSPDSITIVAKDEDTTALFTGDTLFIGDVGRPDLRENVGNMKAKREELALMMFETIRDKFNEFPDDTLIYPAHGAGSLCGKNLSAAASSSLGEERQNNWAFLTTDKDEFLKELLEGQPFIPSYFGYDVDLNKQGAPSLEESRNSIKFEEDGTPYGVVVDTREESLFKKGHIKGSFNIQAVSPNSKFETWLGAILKPNEPYTLVINTSSEKEGITDRISKIGYELFLEKLILTSGKSLETTPTLDLEHFKNNSPQYTIVDIRNQGEINDGKFFDNALEHPLNDLRTTAAKIPVDKPIVVHCAGGYRSAAGSSIIQSIHPNATVYDLSDRIKDFQ